MNDFQKYKNILAYATHNNNPEYLTKLADQFNNTYSHEGSEYWRKLLEVSKMHNKSNVVYSSASEHLKPQVEAYCTSKCHSLLIEESKTLTQSEKLDSILSYFKEKGNSTDFDRQNFKWGLLTSKCGGNPGFSVLVSKLYEDHRIKDNHIIPHGDNFIGYVETERREQIKNNKEEEIRNLEHEKLILEVKKLKEDKSSAPKIEAHFHSTVKNSNIALGDKNNQSLENLQEINPKIKPTDTGIKFNIISWVVKLIFNNPLVSTIIATIVATVLIKCFKLS